ncbi:MAG TPA: hypothetical protein VLL77_12080 [Anaerolineales bacterium]|nr:hypothetical protein [Anaerolineales bacterium]
MPAIDQARLDRQIQDIVAAFGDPARLRYRVLDLFEFYASRVRPATPASGAGVLPSLGVPAPVLRAVEAALRARALDDRLAAGMAAEALWTGPVVESRLVAITLLEIQPPEDLPPWVEAWAQTAGDASLLERLAGGPMRIVHRLAPERFWEATGANLASGHGAVVILGVRSLEASIDDMDAGELPRAFEALGGMTPPEAGEAWRAEVALVRALARRSPPETAQFLVDQIEQARPGATRIARQMLEAFPALERDALRRSLRLSAPG